jgi:SAM-dependent methyltransferase
MTCRVCGAPGAGEAGRVEYLQGFDWPVWDCGACGCRFTAHDPDVHDWFHRAPSISYYQDYVTLLEQCRQLFAARDAAGLERLLRTSAKYRFIIEELANVPGTASVLEVGCARGHLTSYSILEGRRILGVDVSEEAIRSAREAFGDHFAVAGTPAASAAGPFDVIYHVGLIGCVADPIGLTRQLLGRLKPSGRLLFNAPNRDALQLDDQLWLDSAPPPDLVTLFPAGFWRQQFPDAAVTETVDRMSADASLAIAARRWLGVRWHPPAPQPPEVRGHHWTQPGAGWRGLTARAIAKAGRVSGLNTRVAAHPAEFGLFVRMSPTAS